MHLNHEFTVPAGPEETWTLLTDLDRVGSCFPGATVTEADAERFTGTVKVKLGPIAMLYAGSGRFVERDDAAHTAVIEAQGKDKRGNGTAGATVTLRLVPDGEGTRAEVGTDLSVTGKPAQFGRGVMQDVSDKLLGQFIDCIEDHLGGGGAAKSAANAAGTADPAAVSAGAAPVSEPATGPTPDPKASSPAESPLAGPSPPSHTTSHTTSPTSSMTSSTAPPLEDDAIDLGQAVLPVLARRYGGYALAGLVGLLVGLKVGRGRGAHGPS